MYQSLNNPHVLEAGREVDESNELGAMNEPDKSGLLPLSSSIWDRPLITTCTGVTHDGRSYAGCKCGFCPCNSDGSAFIFCTQNATKALCHVARIKGFDIRPCRGIIPSAKVQQYRMLYQSKAANKDQRQQNRIMNRLFCS